MIWLILIISVCVALVLWYSVCLTDYRREMREIRKKQEIVDDAQAAKNAEPNTSAIVKHPHETE
jgi:hypothetical protein